MPPSIPSHLFSRLFLWATALTLVAGLFQLWNVLPLLETGTWRLLPLPRLSAWLAGPDAGLTQAHILSGLFAGLGALFALLSWLGMRAVAPWPLWVHALRLFFQMLIAVLLDPWALPGLVYLLAVELAFLLPLNQALAGLVAQIALLELANFGTLQGGALQLLCNQAVVQPPPVQWLLAMESLSNVAFQVFAFSIGYFLRSEMVGRLQLEQLHDDLVGVQGTLAETVQAAERDRISLRVHAAIQSHLEALDGQMALALREVRGEAWAPVHTAHELTRSLWKEVRDWRDGAPGDQPVIDLRGALETLRQRIPSPRVVLEVGDEPLVIASSALAHAIFRILQEATSNAVRHAGATELRIAVSQSTEGVDIRVSDDGKGPADDDPAAQGGSGLRCMRERVAEFHGRMTPLHPPQGGFGWQIWLPLPREVP